MNNIYGSAGIDGMIVDWYGIENHSDYSLLHRNTGRCFDFTQKANLEFIVCYEDATFYNMVGDIFTEDGAIPHAREVMLFLQNNWFASDHYLKSGDHPILLNFGPMYFHEGAQWDSIFTVLNPKPIYVPVHEYMAQEPVATGYFPWVPLGPRNTGGPSQAEVNAYLDNFYQSASGWEYIVGAAFPGFYDIYEEAGVQPSFGYLDARDGETFINSLRKSLEYAPDVIQIITWNDFGEGTIVEPTEEFGYQYLEMIQDARRDYIDTTFSYTYSDLEIPLQLFELRKSFETDNEVNLLLDSVFDTIVAGDLVAAVTIIDSLNATIKLDDGTTTPREFALHPAYPNPFNPASTIQYDLPQATEVSLVVFDILGREVAMLVDSYMESGYHRVQWNGQGFPSGIYIARLVTPAYTKSIKMVLLK